MDELVTTLDRMREAVLSGKYQQLSQMSKTLEDLLQSMPRTSESELALVRQSAVRNAALLQAAIRGVQSARHRMAELRDAFSGHQTYGPGGKRSAVSAKSATLHQRF